MDIGRKCHVHWRDFDMRSSYHWFRSMPLVALAVFAKLLRVSLESSIPQRHNPTKTQQTKCFRAVDFFVRMGTDVRLPLMSFIIPSLSPRRWDL